MDNSLTVRIKQFPQPPAEPSDISAHIHLAMATKPPQLIKTFALYKDYDIIFSCILVLKK